MALDPEEWWRDRLTQSDRDAFMDNAGKPLTPELIAIATRTGAFPAGTQAPNAEHGPADMGLSQTYVGLIDREAKKRG